MRPCVRYQIYAQSGCVRIVHTPKSPLQVKWDETPISDRAKIVSKQLKLFLLVLQRHVITMLAFTRTPTTTARKAFTVEFCVCELLGATRS